MVNPWVGIALVLGCMLALMLGMHAYRTVHPAGAELSRKVAHVGLGVLTLTFPWLFDQLWPALVTCAAIIGWLALLRYSSVVKAAAGGVIDSVGRRSLGDVYFPVSVAVLFALANRDPILYCVPLVVLSLADTAAALVGSSYGHLKYTTPEGSRKSAEGSIAFLMVAFFCIHVPLLLFTTSGRAETLLIALILGLLVTLFEAIAWHGLDNLFIPLGGFFLLRQLLTFGVGELSVNLGILAAVAVIAAVRRRSTTLDDSALMGAVLAGYVIWVLQGWHWLVIPLVLFLRGTPLARAQVAEGLHFHHLQAVVSVVASGLVWLAIASLSGLSTLFYAFTMSFAVGLAVFEYSRLVAANPDRSLAAFALLGGLRGWLLVFVPFVLVAGPSRDSVLLAIAAVPIVVVALGGFLWTQGRAGALPTDMPRWFRQAAWSALGSAAALAPMSLV